MLFQYFDEPIFRSLPFFQCLPTRITYGNLRDNLKTNMVAIANKAFIQRNPLSLSITHLFDVRVSVCVNVNFFVWIRFGVAVFAYLRGRVGGHFSLLSVFLATSDSGVNEKNEGTPRDILLEAHWAAVFFTCANLIKVVHVCNFHILTFSFMF